jgi:cardiolipin synthase
MRDIWKTIADIGIKFHPSKVKVLTDRISKLKSVSELDLLDFFGTEKKLTRELIEAWTEQPELSKETISGAIFGASRTATNLDEAVKLEMVWTGPESKVVPSRSTRQVILDAISTATEEVFIVSYVAYDVDLIMDAIII